MKRLALLHLAVAFLMFALVWSQATSMQANTAMMNSPPASVEMNLLARTTLGESMTAQNEMNVATVHNNFQVVRNLRNSGTTLLLVKSFESEFKNPESGSLTGIEMNIRTVVLENADAVNVSTAQTKVAKASETVYFVRNYSFVPAIARAGPQSDELINTSSMYSTYTAIAATKDFDKKSYVDTEMSSSGRNVDQLKAG